MWKRIAEHLPLPNVVDFLLQGERVERRERKTEKQADVSVEHGERLTKSMLDLFWPSLDGGGVGDSPMRRHGLPRPQRTDLVRCVIADCEDEIKRGGIRLREFIPGLAREVLSAQTRVLDLAEASGRTDSEG
jgi:hypothetical protein